MTDQSMESIENKTHFSQGIEELLMTYVSALS